MERMRMDRLEDLPGCARAIAEVMTGGVWALKGEMGAGKTTLVSALCALWGVEDAVSSPTFSLVNEYLTAAGDPVYHFDFYRIASEEEAMDMGVDEYFSSGALCLVEWPGRIPGLLPDLAGTVEIALDGGTRWVTVTRG